MTLPPVIEQGIPIPKRRIEPRSLLTRMLYRLEVGESFLVPLEYKEDAVRNAINSARQAYKRRGERTAFTYRTLMSGRIRAWKAS